MFQRKKRKYGTLDDSELITLYKSSKDVNAFAIVYERYSHLVFGTCLKYLKDEFEAEDLTSKIFEELSEKLLKHNIEYFKGWLYRLTKNECLMFLRKQKTKVLNCKQILLLEQNETSDVAQKEAQLTQLETQLNLLKDEQATCLKLFYLEDKSYQEVALLMNLDLKQVKSAIQNGKRNLKILLIQHDEFKNT
jgi:RNA polymerase sigma factor (sigma-70 family)